MSVHSLRLNFDLRLGSINEKYGMVDLTVKKVNE